MCRNYKTNLIEQELNKLNLIENITIRKSCMSILSYLIKKYNEKNNEYLKAELDNLNDQSVFKISFRTFLQKYNRYHHKLSIGTLKNRIDLLLKYKLIKLESRSTYSFFRNELNEKLNEDLNNLKDDQTIDNTDIEPIKDEPKSLNLELESNFIINNSVTNNTFQPKIFVSNIQEIEEQLNYQLDKFNLTVIDFAVREAKRRLKKIIAEGTLRFTGVENYIISTLSSIKNKFIPNCIKNKKQNINTQENEQVDENLSVLDELEQISKDNKNELPIENNSKTIDSFNNYEQRTYDYDDLEKKLLGWE